MSRGQQCWLFFFVPALLAVVVYLPAVGHQFVWDDFNLIVYNRESPFLAFQQSFWHGAGERLGADPYYRPLVNFSFRLERQIFGLRPGLFHLVNILLHGVVVGLFSWLVAWLSRSNWAGAIAGAIFGLHPMLVDTVAYISGRTDLLAALGLIGASAGIINYFSRGGWWWIIALLGFGLAVFAKESAVGFLVVVGVSVFLGRRIRVQQWLIVIAGTVAILLSYLVLRSLVLGNLLGMELTGEAVRLVIFGLNSFGQQLTMFLFPFGQRLFYWYAGVFDRVTGFALIGLLYLALPVVMIRRFFPQRALLGWLWSVVLLLPFAWISGFGPAGRLLYLSGIGIVVLIVSTGEELIKNHRRYAGVLAILVSGWLMFTMPGFFQRMRWWRDEIGLFSRMVIDAPGYAPGHYNRAMALLGQGDTSGALVELRQAVACDSSAISAVLNLAALLQKKGDWEEAVDLYRYLNKKRPDFAPAYVNLGIILYRQGDTTGAINTLREAVRLAPDDGVLWYNLAWLYRIKGEIDSARGAAERAVQLVPGEPRFRALLEEVKR